MNFQNILLENEGQISTITINRPQSLNALNGATISELSEALSQLEQDSNCRVIIITGSGEKSFVAGADIKEFSDFGQDKAEELDSNRVAHFDRNEDDNDHYTQPGILYTKAMNQEDRTNLVNNIIGHMKKIDGPKRDEIINRQLCHFFRANVEMGMRIAAGLQVKLDEGIMNHAK